MSMRRSGVRAPGTGLLWGAAATVLVTGSGCILLTEYDNHCAGSGGCGTGGNGGSPGGSAGSGGASHGGSGGSLGGSGGAGGSGGSVGGSGGTAHGGSGGSLGGSGGAGGSGDTMCGELDSCWGGPCVNGECQPVVLDLPNGWRAQRIAVAGGRLFVPVGGAMGAQALRIDPAGIHHPDGELAMGEYEESDLLPGDEVGFVTAYDQMAVFSPKTVAGLYTFDFANNGLATHHPLNDNYYLRLAVSIGPNPLELYAVKAPADAVSKWAGADITGAEEPLPGLDPSPGTAHGVAAAPDGRVAVTIVASGGNPGCVALLQGTGCMLPSCIQGTDVLGLTDVTFDSQGNLYFLTDFLSETDRGAVWQASKGAVCSYGLSKLVGLNWQGGSAPRSLAVDDTHVYVAALPEPPANPTEVLYACPKMEEVSGIDKCPVVVTLPGSILGIAADAQAVYFATTNGGDAAKIGWKRLH